MDHQILSLVKWRNLSFMYKHCLGVEMFKVMTSDLTFVAFPTVRVSQPLKPMLLL